MCACVCHTTILHPQWPAHPVTSCHLSDHALVYWQSSMYVQVHTSVGMKIQVQMSPEVQLYITPPSNHTAMISGWSLYTQIADLCCFTLTSSLTLQFRLWREPVCLSGLCGNNNNDTTDDFTTSCGIIENSPQPFALSWSLDACAVNIPDACVSIDNGDYQYINTH